MFFWVAVRALGIMWLFVAFSLSCFLSTGSRIEHPDLVKLFNRGAKAMNGAGDPPIPQLSTSWTANVIDPPDGPGLEKYHFVDDGIANLTNPSGHWFIYSDTSRACTSLEYYVTGDAKGEGRYYLDCPTDCCEDYSGTNIKEWRIGAGKNGMENTQYIGNATIESWGKNWTCMGWQTQYHGAPHTVGEVTYKYWLTFPTNNISDVANTILHRIDYRADTTSGEIQYQNFTPIVGEEAQAQFAQEFVLPTACTGNDVYPCDSD